MPNDVSLDDLLFRDYYQEDLYITADVEVGILYNRSGRRMLALTDDFLIGLHKALEKECLEDAPKVIRACGRRWGQKFGAGLAGEWSDFYGQSFREFPMALFQSLLIQEFAHNGWGKLEINYEHFESGIVWFSLQGAIMSAIRKDAPDSRADQLTAGILGGMFTFFLEREMDCIQSQSEAEGYSDSRFVMSSSDRIARLIQDSPKSLGHSDLVAYLLKH